MSDQIEETPQNETNDPLKEKIISQINEERLLKDLSSVQLNRFKSMDEMATEIAEASNSKELLNLLNENLEESSESLISRYLLGMISLMKEGGERVHLLRSLMETYQKSAKWMIVDHIADQILTYDENNRHALRSKVESTERLRGKKEIKPFLEKLAAIDKKNPDVAKKFALSILEEDKERALKFLKAAAEAYARIKDYKNLEEAWNIIVANDHHDLPYFEKIERILVGNREKTRIAAYLVQLVEPFKTEENWPAVITILKKILEYEPSSSRARSDLVRAYRTHYSGHSLLDEFLKMSELTNHKRTVGPCIASFERNIVFDKDNYVYHRTRGVGKIKSIDSSEMIIDFEDNPDQKMTIKMAISSLQPLGPDHIWVKTYENPDDVKEIFESDLPLFFEMLLSSFNNTITLAEIKAEIVPRYVSAKDWSKWWTRARSQLKKEPKFGFNPKKKDELILRETPMTLSEELIMRFQSQSDWNKKLDLAMESIKSAEAEDALQTFYHHYREQEESRDHTRQLHSFLFIEAATAAYPDEDFDHSVPRELVYDIIQNAEKSELLNFNNDTSILDFKRELVNIMIKTRKDYPEILFETLFEVPIKNNRYVLTELNRLGHTETLKKFVQRAFSRYREHPEVFLWAARSILSRQWNYDWIEKSKQEVLLAIFRLLKPLTTLEKKGSRLKNSAIEAIFGSTNITVESIQKGHLAEIINDVEVSAIRRMYALFKEVSYVPDAHKENFLAYLTEMRPDFTQESVIYEEEDEEEDVLEQLLPDENVILVSPDGYEKRKAYLDHLINVEMPENSKDIGIAQEKGDLRENAEYKAAMEKQATLRAEITNLNNELKKAQLIESHMIRTDIVSIGSRVTVSTGDGQTIDYTIFGPWEADTDNNIISYVSPLGMALLGKKQGETASLESNATFTVQEINPAL